MCEVHSMGLGPPTGAGRGARLGRGRRHAIPACLGMHPPFSLFAAPKRENGPCTVQKRKGRFWRLRRPHALIEGRLADLLRGRMDAFLFPRFAHSRVWLGWMVRLTGVSGRFPLPIKRLDGLWRLLEGLRRHFAVPHMSETGLFEILTGFPAISPPRDSFGPFEGNIPRLKINPVIFQFSQ